MDFDENYFKHLRNILNAPIPNRISLFISYRYFWKNVIYNTNNNLIITSDVIV